MQGTALVLLPGFIYQFRKMGSDGVSTKDWQIILASSVFLAIHFGAWVWSLDHTSLVHSLLFVSIHPLVLVLLMPAIGLAVRRGHITGVMVGITGALLSLGDVEPGGEVTVLGDAAAFLGAVTVVGYLLAGRHLRSERRMPIFVYAFPVTFAAGIWLALAAISQEGASMTDVVPEISLLGWTDALWLPWIAYLSLGPGLCGHTGINTVLRWITPITVSITLLFEPVVGGIIGWLWTGEATLGIWTVLGGPLMLVGAIMVTLEEERGGRDRDAVS
jgi:drug/metabolite transporter (DMT)-like permease